MFAGKFLAALALAVVGVALGLLIAATIAICRSFWIRPRFQTMPLEEGIVDLNRPELVYAAERFDEAVTELDRLGFRSFERLIAPDVSNRTTLVLLLAREPATDTMAGVQIVFHGQPSDPELRLRGEFLGFETQYETADLDLITVQTTTSPQMFPAPPTHRVRCVDFLPDTASVFAAHQRHCEENRAAESRVAPDADELVERLMRRHARTMAAAVERGYLEPVRPGLLQFTMLGSLRVATKLFWPFGGASKLRERRRQLAG